MELSEKELVSQIEYTSGEEDRCLYYLWPGDIVQDRCKWKVNHRFRHNTIDGKDGGWRKIGSHTVN